jgi:hypothetical protein
MNGADIPDEIPDEIPDLMEERARRAVRRWLLEDQESRALLAELEDDPIGGEMALKERVEQSAPTEVKTYLRMSGGSVERLVNVAKAEQLHIHHSPSAERPLVRLFLKPLSTKLQVGAADPLVVVARVANQDTMEREAELTVSGWFSELSQIDGGRHLVVPAGGHIDTRINVAITPAHAAALPAGSHSLDVEVAVKGAEDTLAWVDSKVTLEVLPFQRVHAEFESAKIRSRNWSRQWIEYRLSVQNRGNEPAEIEIDGEFDDSSVEFEPPEGRTHLSLGSQRELPIRVRAVRNNFSFQEQIHPFRVYISTGRGDQDDLLGELWHPSFFTPKKKLGLVALVIILAAFFLPSPSDPISPQEQSVSTTMTRAKAAASTVKAVAATESAVPSEPESVVRAFYDAVNRRDYEAAWAMLGSKKLRMTRTGFERGFADTDHVEVDVRKAGSTTITVRLIADEAGYQRRSIYEVTYTVRDGLIESGEHWRRIR